MEQNHDNRCELLTATDSILLSGHFMCSCAERAKQVKSARRTRGFYRHIKQAPR